MSEILSSHAMLLVIYMATTLHSCGVKTRSPYISFSRRASFTQSTWRQHHLHFAVHIPPVSGLATSSNNSCGASLPFRISCVSGKVDVLERDDIVDRDSEQTSNELTCVMKFGGSYVASADRMREVADLISSFPEEKPVIVLSAMGKTTNKLLLAGEKAVSCGVSNVSDLEELNFIKNLHFRTGDELGVERSVISKHLSEFEQLLNGIAMMKKMTPRTKDYLVSFGECMSTRIFAAYLNITGVKARQVWKGVDGVLTCDPNIHPLAEPVPYLTFDEAAELAYFGTSSTVNETCSRGYIHVRVKNSYNSKAPGTLIMQTRDMSEAVLTSIVVKRNVTMLDIVKYSNASKVNISLIVNDSETEQCVRALHCAFFRATFLN